MSKEIDWDTVSAYFGLDDSYVYTDEEVAELTQQYLSAMENADRAQAALELIQVIARMSTNSELDGGMDGFDAIETLDDLITSAREILKET